MLTQLMPVDIRDLRAVLPATMESLYWETEPTSDGAELADTACVIDKEAWLSQVQLEWGTAGQNLICLDPDRTLGTIIYAPPRFVPRQRHLPTAPVSADAIVVTSLKIAPGFQGEGLESLLVDGAVADLTRRGVKAIEAFGCTHRSDEVIAIELLLEAGFHIVADDPQIPRLRLDLPGQMNWSMEVEMALDQLQQEQLFRSMQVSYPVPVRNHKKDV